MESKRRTRSSSGSIILLAIILTAAVCCGRKDNGDFTSYEKALINDARTDDGIMRVLTICDSADLAVLRAPSSDLSPKALHSSEFRTLCSLMTATVTHPSQDGVGIAAPQVGLNRRVIVVQRFDKEGEPFEVYPNVRIVWASDSLAYGPEGCLSVPGRKGDVPRSQEIVIEYAQTGICACGHDDTMDCGTDPDLTDRRGNARRGNEVGRTRRGQDGIKIIQDTVKGFTAVIFQHEIDHLDGVLYIDRL